MVEVGSPIVIQRKEFSMKGIERGVEGWSGVERERDEEEMLRHKIYDWMGTAYLLSDQLVCGIEMWRGCCQSLVQLLPVGYEDGEGDHDDVVWKLMSST